MDKASIHAIQDTLKKKLNVKRVIIYVVFDTRIALTSFSLKSHLKKDFFLFQLLYSAINFLIQVKRQWDQVKSQGKIKSTRARSYYLSNFWAPNWDAGILCLKFRILSMTFSALANLILKLRDHIQLLNCADDLSWSSTQSLSPKPARIDI